MRANACANACEARGSAAPRRENASMLDGDGDKPGVQRQCATDDDDDDDDDAAGVRARDARVERGDRGCACARVRVRDDDGEDDDDDDDGEGGCDDGRGVIGCQGVCVVVGVVGVDGA